VSKDTSSPPSTVVATVGSVAAAVILRASTAAVAAVEAVDTLEIRRSFGSVGWVRADTQEDLFSAPSNEKQSSLATEGQAELAARSIHAEAIWSVTPK